MEIVALAVTYHIRANIAQPYKMASDSMCPALMKGDRFFVNKAIYRRLEPQRGDIVVFDYPVDPKRTFIERLVGLPGETVELRDGRVVVNGVVKTEGSLSQFYYYNQAPYADEGQFTTVPADSYFVLGDNSGNSMDSRSWGFVPKKNLTGKAYKIYWPLDRSGPLE
ncbi:MAG: signal peptidase I [Candidatus Omnitrophica bacterium]|nr:signal peptidase I [Candidatus Omnitrophota bacterium]